MNYRIESQFMTRWINDNNHIYTFLRRRALNKKTGKYLLKRLDRQHIDHQIYLKFKDIFRLFINYYLAKKTSNFSFFLHIFEERIPLQKEI